MRVIKSLFSLALISILVTSCKTTQTGIGTSTIKNSTITKVEETQSLKILDIDFAEAKKLQSILDKTILLLSKTDLKLLK